MRRPRRFGIKRRGYVVLCRGENGTYEYVGHTAAVSPGEARHVLGYDSDRLHVAIPERFWDPRKP